MMCWILEISPANDKIMQSKKNKAIIYNIIYINRFYLLKSKIVYIKILKVSTGI